jgi:hypothetical protein
MSATPGRRSSAVIQARSDPSLTGRVPDLSGYLFATPPRFFAPAARSRHRERASVCVWLLIRGEWSRRRELTSGHRRPHPRLPRGVWPTPHPPRCKKRPGTDRSTVPGLGPSPGGRLATARSALGPAGFGQVGEQLPALAYGGDVRRLAHVQWHDVTVSVSWPARSTSMLWPFWESRPGSRNAAMAAPAIVHGAMNVQS